MLKKSLFFVLIFVKLSLFGQTITLVTWNLCNFGKSKSSEEIAFIANELKSADIVAIQEVSTTDFGAQAVAKLADELNRKGAKWDYVISNPTNGAGKERYAYLWKTSKISISGKGFLAEELDKEFDREPFMARFSIGKSKILLATLHAVPKDKNPAEECKYLFMLEKLYPNENILIMGDFNLSEKEEAFTSLKKEGYNSAIINQKTSLKMKPSKTGEKLGNEYDNIFYEYQLVEKLNAGIYEFYKKFVDLKTARTISDHVPVYLQFKIK